MRAQPCILENPSILFLCAGNACRSQIAEGWMRHFWKDEFDVFSAGIEAHGINPFAARVMAEVGLDISAQQSKTIAQLPDREFDYIITVCEQASRACLTLPGQMARLHVAFDDPPRLARGAQTEAQILAPYRRVRDEIRDFISALDNYLNLP